MAAPSGRILWQGNELPAGLVLSGIKIAPTAKYSERVRPSPPLKKICRCGPAASSLRQIRGRLLQTWPRAHHRYRHRLVTPAVRAHDLRFAVHRRAAVRVDQSPSSHLPDRRLPRDGIQRHKHECPAYFIDCRNCDRGCSTVKSYQAQLEEPCGALLPYGRRICNRHLKFQTTR
jgi:hypothetical protein